MSDIPQGLPTSQLGEIPGIAELRHSHLAGIPDDGFDVRVDGTIVSSVPPREFSAAADAWGRP